MKSRPFLGCVNEYAKVICFDIIIIVDNSISSQKGKMMRTHSAKHLISTVFILVLLIALLQSNAFATNSISHQNLDQTVSTDVGFKAALSNGELESLLNNATSNSTIKLNKDYCLVDTMIIDGKNITLDLNNHNIMFRDECYFGLIKGSLSIIGHGTIWGDSQTSVFAVCGSDDDSPNYSSLTVGSGVEIRQYGHSHGIIILSSPGENASYGVKIDFAGQINILSDSKDDIVCSGILVSGKNSYNAKNLPTITLRENSAIRSGRLRPTASYGIYTRASCNIVSEGTITDCDTCFLLEQGNVEIRKGTYTSYHAPIVYGNDKINLHTKLTIKDGTFKNDTGGDIVYLLTELRDAEVYISGGAYSYYPDVFLVKGKKAVWNNSDRMLHVVDDPTTPSHENCPSAKFNDVNKSESHWTHKPIDYVLNKGYMAGVSSSSFNPNGTVTRATIAQILYAAEGKPSVSGKAKFTDVKNGKWYANAVNWAASKGLVSGYGNGIFKPDAPVTREQMVTIMYKYSEMKGYDLSTSADLSSYADQSKVSKYAVSSMKWAVNHKIISGTKNGIEPKGNATRAQIAVILQAYDNHVRK